MCSQMAPRVLSVRVPVPRPDGATSGSSCALLGISAIIGLVYTFYLFPVDFLVGRGAFWREPPIEDIATGVAGMRYYAHDEWWFPLFRTVKIASPQGISVTYLDTL